MRVNDFSVLKLSTGNNDGKKSVSNSTSKFFDVLSESTTKSLNSIPEATILQPNIIDNNVNTALILCQKSENIDSSMTRVSSASTFNEMFSMRQIFNSGVNVDGYLAGWGTAGGPRSATIMPINRVLYSNFDHQEAVHQYSDDRAMTTLEGQESTPDNPIMYVASKDKDNGGFAWYKVSLNQVDPCNATREEMFALLVYMTKDDANASFEALDTFNTIDEYGIECGLLSETQVQNDYLAVFKIIAKDLNEKLEANYDVGTIDQKSYDDLLKIIDKMTAHSSKVKEQLTLVELSTQQDIIEKVESKVINA
jgi:hypothetical protein